MPTMQEWRELNKADSIALAERVGSKGVSTPAQRSFFRAAKPTEELYDTAVDPHEISDLARSPKHRVILNRMRAALDRWIRETKDLGAIPEHILKERMRPGDRWAVTSPPVITLRDGVAELAAHPAAKQPVVVDEQHAHAVSHGRPRSA